MIEMTVIIVDQLVIVRFNCSSTRLRNALGI